MARPSQEKIQIIISKGSPDLVWLVDIHGIHMVWAYEVHQVPSPIQGRGSEHADIREVVEVITGDKLAILHIKARA